MPENEATVKIKINEMLKKSDWRFIPDENGPANVFVEARTNVKFAPLDNNDSNIETFRKGFIDYLLTDNKNRPLMAIEAKAAGVDPLIGKEQARRYALAENCHFVALSNGVIHYLWDINEGNPYPISQFPTQTSLMEYKKNVDAKNEFNHQNIEADYLATIINPNYQLDPDWINENSRETFVKMNRLRFLRPYQVEAINSLQEAFENGKRRFLFEMATGTGKTTVAAGVIKFFHTSGLVNRTIVFVDRVLLRDQCLNALIELLSKDLICLDFERHHNDWRKAHVVVATIQSLLRRDKYKDIFSPTDFNFVISDEAHRTISGSARPLFEYFVGYKLGLTATPKSYFRQIDKIEFPQDSPIDIERRLLKDTYATFGCEYLEPTYRYTLLDGVKDGNLVNPTRVDARTEITNALLSERRYRVPVFNDSGAIAELVFDHKKYEKVFFSEPTNRLFCQTFMKYALRDEITGEIGKTIIFTINQNHARKITKILNELAAQAFPGKYSSDFAYQITSNIKDSQELSILFANNNLGGSGNFDPLYKTSKCRVCVTVSMMSTGFDCVDLLNVVLMKPLFSPTEFVQIKGRGTRVHDFRGLVMDSDLKKNVKNPRKTTFKLIDFFAVCEYFEKEYDYDQIIQLPPIRVNKAAATGLSQAKKIVEGTYENFDPDKLTDLTELKIGLSGMRIDREYFNCFISAVKNDKTIAEMVTNGHIDSASEYLSENYLANGETKFDRDTLSRSLSLDRKATFGEFLQLAFNIIPDIKNKDQLLEEYFTTFANIYNPPEIDDILHIKNFFKIYLTSKEFRDILDNEDYSSLFGFQAFSTKDYAKVPLKYRQMIPDFIRSFIFHDPFETFSFED
ncbi:MAG: DEAD/DEAH box helicase family protein [Deltaproteobacteria bacterium]|jgi:type I restriction enzyme R subunit|nr:DEAD/DEAH box helicase family protein [Deltaproteobacteria bacterium]